ncbi:hypothetical protein C8J57DRAFT_1540457 [Mycena rebaudengoi]|nr:hypothetical protein C8J57DRAFT_1540457 [Mycena rebaudengoi]
MDLPPIVAYRRGARMQPLMNFPALDNSLLFFLASNIMSHGKRAAACRTVTEAILLASPAVKTITHARGANNFFIPVALSEKQRTRQGIYATTVVRRAQEEEFAAQRENIRLSNEEERERMAGEALLVRMKP